VCFVTQRQNTELKVRGKFSSEKNGLCSVSHLEKLILDQRERIWRADTEEKYFLSN
jgi:hypothetical protein